MHYPKPSQSILGEREPSHGAAGEGDIARKGVGGHIERLECGVNKKGGGDGAGQSVVGGVEIGETD